MKGFRRKVAVEQAADDDGSRDNSLDFKSAIGRNHFASLASSNGEEEDDGDSSEVGD